jgi:hypothetical protein
MKKFIWAFLNLIKIGGPIQLAISSIIKDEGWFLSFYSKKSINKNKEPIPWFSYPAIKFIESRLNKNLSVFEYGCGNSTIWFAGKVKNIISVEHDKTWMDSISSTMPTNAQIIFQTLEIDGDYAKECVNQNQKFNIIIIEGRNRLHYAKNCIEALTDDGIIIFDNSHTDEYSIGANYISESGFRRIDFIGLTPIISHSNTTTILYRSNNCFNI